MKMIKVFLLIFALINTTYAAKITDPVLNVGKQATNDFTILHKDGGYIKKVGSQGDWFFSKDGVLEKKIGSGGGTGGDGGVNILANNGFEDGLTDWITSGGTLTQETFTNSLDTNTKYAKFVATTSGQYIETSCTTVPSSFSPDGMMSDIKFSSSETAGTWVLKVFDCDSGDVLKASTDIPKRDVLGESLVKLPTVTVPKLIRGKLRVESTGAGTIHLDDGYLGSNKGFIPGQTLEKETSYTPIFNGFGTPSEIEVSYTKISLDKILINARLRSGTVTGVEARVGLPNGITVAGPSTGSFTVGRGVREEATASSKHFNVIATSGETFVKFQYQHKGDAVNPLSPSLASNLVTSSQIFSFQAVVPVNGLEGSSPLSAYTPEQSSFYIQGKISGSNIALAGTSEPSLQQLVSPGLTLTNEQGIAQISCDGASPEGTTCTGSEEIGIAFNAPVAGTYEVCFDFNHQSTLNGSMSTMYFIDRRQVDDSGSIEVGQIHRFIDREVNGHDFFEMHTLCNRFKVGSVGPARFDMKYTKTAGSGNFNVNNAGANNNQSLQYRVKLVNNFVSRPIIQNMVDTKNPNGMRFEACRFFNNGSTIVIDTSSGECSNWIQSVTRIGTGRPDVDIKPGVFGAQPTCVCLNAELGGGNRGCGGAFYNDWTATHIELAQWSSGGALVDDPSIHLICGGVKP